MFRSQPSDSFDLHRFVRAQDGVYEQVLNELTEGRKRTHWMWFIFPQIRGLGHSSMSKFYAISSLAEAEAYLNHPLLGPRLHECTNLTNRVITYSADNIFGYVDALKFHSSMTLFAHAASNNVAESVFSLAITKYFGGKFDPLTLEKL